MARKAQEARLYPAPMDYFLFQLRNIGAAGLDMVVKSENPTPTGVWFRLHAGMSMRSYGEKITVTLTPQANGATHVDILSECGMPTQLVDYGKNAQNLRRLFEYFEATLPVNRPQPAPQFQQPAPQFQQPAPQASSADAPRFCGKCGTPVTPGARFCGKCGNQLF